MVKKNALLFVVLGVSSSCFGMNKNPKNNKQNIFSVATMQILKFFFNPNKPKQLPAPTSIPKEFVCEEKTSFIKIEKSPIKENRKSPDSELKLVIQRAAAQADAEEKEKIQKEVDAEHIRLMAEIYKKRK